MLFFHSTKFFCIFFHFFLKKLHFPPKNKAFALSGREGYELLSFYFLPFNFYNVVSAMLSRQSSVLVVLDFLDRNEDG